MPKIISVGFGVPPYELTQQDTLLFAKELFSESFKDINRLLTVFQNGQIEKRNFAKDLSWFQEDHTFEEKNDAFIESAVELGTKAIEDCLTNKNYVSTPLPCGEIEAIFYVSTSGLATPSIEARIMNKLAFSDHTKRIPIWGLGCAGGAAGLSRAYEYCKAFPRAKVLVLSIELCSLTFQRNDRSKSNLIGTSLFADGVAAALVAGDEADTTFALAKSYPYILHTQSTLMPNSEDVMGWEIKNDGLFVVFSKDIPTIIDSWLGGEVESFLQTQHLTSRDLKHFVAHPGGKKVLEAYVSTLWLNENMIADSLDVLKNHGNMSSATVLYVLDRFMKKEISSEEYGLLTALGPGFSSEMLLLEWR
ncbi:3-oxoacyl-[acyl-carrier-protein] synthase III C-terminal domain-containing protein [Priestia megaterium]|uniref:type III polyketide synthase n=1 Tax=Priestia megaterium TaxID=1404 RepID=UPI000BF43B45|nr:3-oxoacyl-[acyl-carrier-protein] synthase III C-terminal domain-containing protein [Priestia megaterium]PFJ98508.1 type III polyketide synthase [Priestia megaterium]PMD11090.1 type III polyketide synthase [Priestia megaterium]